MDKQAIIKWAAIGIGAYIVYAYLRDSGILAGILPGDSAAAPAVGTGTGAGTQPSTGTSTATGTQPSTGTGTQTAGSAGSAGGSSTNPPPGPAPADELDVAARVAAATGSGTRLNADQWNWYWSRESGVQQTAELFPPENRGALMSLTDYISRRAAAGLSGLGGGMGAYANAFDAVSSWVV